MAKSKRISFFKDKQSRNVFMYHFERLQILFPKMSRADAFRATLGLLARGEPDELRMLRLHYAKRKKKLKEVV
jgi:hypothetical protein